MSSPATLISATSGSGGTALSGPYQSAFQAIYQEVVAATREISEALVHGGDVPTFESVQQRLIDIVERVSGDALHLPPTHEKRLALYVVVAMADEVFLRTPSLYRWPGRDSWTRLPLEEQLFHSHSAGERFFDMLDGALSNQVPLSNDLLKVFLTALGLGFSGRFGDGKGPELYRARLADHLSHVSHVLGYDPADSVAADAVLFRHSTTTNAQRIGLPGFANGVVPILAVVALWLVIGFGVWTMSTHRLSVILDTIEATR